MKTQHFADLKAIFEELHWYFNEVLNGPLCSYVLNLKPKLEKQIITYISNDSKVNACLKFDTHAVSYIHVHK